MQTFSEGYRAGLVGTDPRMCPYEKLSREWQDWQRGHGIGVELIANGAFEEVSEAELRDGASVKMDAMDIEGIRWAQARIAELENAIAQHKLKQWGGEGVEVSSEADAALYAHLQN